MTRQKQRIMAITLIGVLLCIVSLLALHVGTIMIPIGGGRAKYFKWHGHTCELHGAHYG